jgi:hypothetical protein
MSATYGDRKHMQTYFGVTATQTIYSGYRTYTAKAGFENVTAGVNWNHVLDANWSVHSGLGVNPPDLGRGRQPAHQTQDHAHADDRADLQVLSCLGVSLTKTHR